MDKWYAATPGVAKLLESGDQRDEKEQAAKSHILASLSEIMRIATRDIQVVSKDIRDPDGSRLRAAVAEISRAANEARRILSRV